MYPMWIFEPHCSKSEKSRHTKKKTSCPAAVKIHPGFHCGL